MSHKSAIQLFRKECRFVAGAATTERIPPATLPEVAFIGRSNVGKSSLINALVNRKDLARTSKTPGRTQQLNFFNLGEQLMLVDLPGYGYAKASKAAISEWNLLIGHYLRSRAALKRVCVLVDSRHGLKDSDRLMMKMLDEHAVSLSRWKRCALSIRRCTRIFWLRALQPEKGLMPRAKHCMP